MGIKFRRESHFRYFVFSLMFLASCAFMSVNYNDRIWLIAARGFFSVNVVAAIFATRFGKINTELYSRDCIWWNGLLAIVLIIIDICIFRK